MKVQITQFLAMILFMVAMASFSQDDGTKKITVKGTVKAADNSGDIAKGEPILGATVAVKGTTKGTVTDFDGNFELKDVPVGATIEVSFVGYEKFSVKITESSTNIPISLKSDSKLLDEVVAVGYATQKKRDVTGSTVSISEKDMKLTLTAGLDQALQGRSAGITVVQGSGAPGQPANVAIRGIGSINGTQPLYVVDGVAVDYNNINMLNPNDIETMEVLKDASAAAIYGSRGSNGVILITTKSGKSGKGVVEYNFQGGVQAPWKLLDYMNAEQYRTFYRGLYGETLGDPNSARPFYTDPALIALHADTDWQKEIFRRGDVQDHSLNIRGGSDMATYKIGLNYYKENGVIQKSDFERYAISVKTDIKPKRWLKVGQSLNFTRVENNQGIGYGQALQTSGTTAPLIPVYAVTDPNSLMFDPNNVGGFGGQIPLVTGANDGINPVANNFFTNQQFARYRLLGSAFAEIEIIKGLKYKLLAGGDFVFNLNKNVNLPYFYGSTEGRNRRLKGIDYNRNHDFMWQLDHILSYSKSIGKHSFDVLAGYSSQYFKNSGFSASGADYPEQINTIEATNNASNFIVGGADEERALIGYLGRINYSYNDKYLFTSNVRYDGSSSFGSNYRYGLFPSFSLGWRLSNEEFLKPVVWISDLKVRLGYGQVGNQDFSNIPGANYLQTQIIYPDIVRYVLGTNDRIVPGAAPTRGLANPNLRWETSETINFGVDFSVFQNALSMALDIYEKNSRDIIIPLPIPDIAGASDAPFYRQASIYSNAGKMQNRGLDALLTYRNEKNAFKFTISPNITLVRNRMTDLEFDILTADSRLLTRQGYPVASMFGWVTDGIVQTTVDGANYVGNISGTHLAQPGDLKFKDLNGDGKIDQDDRAVLGKSFPTASYGLNFTARYKGFDFTLFVQGVEGVRVFNQIYRSGTAMLGPGGGPPDANQLVDVLNAWTPTNTNTNIPRAVANDPNLNTRPSDRYVESADYIRFRNIQLGYTLPEKLLKRTLSTEDNVSLRIYASVQNAITITNYRGYDPEFSITTGREANPTQQGIDSGVFPQSRRWLAGLQFTF